MLLHKELMLLLDFMVPLLQSHLLDLAPMDSVEHLRFSLEVYLQFTA
jgi:hypothetical protein